MNIPLSIQRGRKEVKGQELKGGRKKVIYYET
jgi:hypothetical protein